MDLEISLALLERKKTELQEEYERIKKELEHILFDLPFDYQKAFMDESDKYFIYPCVIKVFQKNTKKIIIAL